MKRASFVRVDRQLLSHASGEPLTTTLLTVPSGATVTESLTWVPGKPVPQASMLRRTIAMPRRIIERSSFSGRSLAGLCAAGCFGSAAAGAAVLGAEPEALAGFLSRDACVAGRVPASAGFSLVSFWRGALLCDAAGPPGDAALGSGLLSDGRAATAGGAEGEGRGGGDGASGGPGFAGGACAVVAAGSVTAGGSGGVAAGGVAAGGVAAGGELAGLDGVSAAGESLELRTTGTRTAPAASIATALTAAMLILREGVGRTVPAAVESVVCAT